MKAKVLFFLAASGLLATAAWFVHAHRPPQAVAVPEKYRDTVPKGLEYLAKSQHKDGHWEGDDGKHPVAMTGLAGLALVMEMDGPRVYVPELNKGGKTKYLANIRKAADWLMDKSQGGRDGLIFSEHASESARYMQGHGLATLFLAGAHEVEQDDARRKKLTQVLTRAVKYIAKAQSSRGGWYNTSKLEGHDLDSISATVIQIQALQAAETASIDVPTGVLRDAMKYLSTALPKYEEGAKPEINRSRLADAAGALACDYGRYGYSKTTANDELYNKWFKYCQTEVPAGRDIKSGRDVLVHYYYAQAVFNCGDGWTEYRTVLFDHLQSIQNKDGSWPAAGEGISVGPVHAAALWCTVLQLEKGNHPSRRPEPVGRIF